MRTDISDVTFIIPVQIDSPERLENLNTILKFLFSHFFTRVIVIEDTGNTGQRVFLPPVSEARYFACSLRSDGVFHRTGVINCGIAGSNTKFISIYDADCIFDPENIIASVLELREGADMVYPYSGKFVDIDRKYISTGEIEERVSFTTESAGGAVFLRREAYCDAGMDNEFLISHCPDDVERFSRMKKLGYIVRRIEGTCWHITHPRGKNSAAVNDFTQTNLAEYKKVDGMTKQQLYEYIQTWPWKK